MSVQMIFSLCVLFSAVWGSPRKKSWRSFTGVLGFRDAASATPLVRKETSMTTPTISAGRKPGCKLTFRIERGPDFLCVAIQGEASFDQAEVISAQLLRIPLDRYSLVVLDLGKLTLLSSLAMGALVEYRRGLGRRGVEVRLANVQAPVWLALELAGLGQLFEPMDLQQPTRPPAMEWPSRCGRLGADFAVEPETPAPVASVLRRGRLLYREMIRVFPSWIRTLLIRPRVLRSVCAEVG
jgi:anti-anti-sigma factor